MATERTEQNVEYLRMVRRMSAAKYIGGIRNKEKRAYAIAWVRYCAGATGKAYPPEGCSAMAAQAVRMQLATFGIEEPATDDDMVRGDYQYGVKP